MNTVFSINGPVVKVKDTTDFSMLEMVYVGAKKLVGEVINMSSEETTIQVYESTTGLKPGEPVTGSGMPMSAVLGPGIISNIFDGIERPLKKLEEISGAFIGEGSTVSSLDTEKKYSVTMKVKVGDSIKGGDIYAVCPETPVIEHRCMLSPYLKGEITWVAENGDYRINDVVAKLKKEDGTEVELTLCQKWPIKQARPFADRLPINKPLITGQRVIDTVLPIAMGVKNDVADYFRRSFEESGVLQRVVMFLNLSNDPIIERILTPRCALTAAEYLAYEKNMHILVILTDMTSYAEAVREFSSSKGEIPARKGYPGYLYSDLASIYERAGVINGSEGSITQIPILTMPNDDITHPVPDLTGYITEGQIVLDRGLEQSGVYPPISVLPSLSRLMKDGIGEGYTRADHSAVSNQLFAAYAKVSDARALASVIGEDELSELDKAYMRFGRMFEKYFVSQGEEENRSIDETLDLGWNLLSLLPKSALDRVDEKLLEEKYNDKAEELFQ